jgi:hypothetical protein
MVAKPEDSDQYVCLFDGKAYTKAKPRVNLMAEKWRCPHAHKPDENDGPVLSQASMGSSRQANTDARLIWKFKCCEAD